MYGCGVCSYSSSRPDNLQRHKKAKHQLVLDAELDLEEAGGDQEPINEVDENTRKKIVDRMTRRKRMLMQILKEV